MAAHRRMTDYWKGKRVLIIGGTQGIGKATALSFAAKGAAVTITGRNQGRGQEVVKEMKRLGSEPMAFESFDVSLMGNVKSFTERFSKSHSESGLHALILTAGGLNYGPRRETSEGLELTFAQNVASRFKLTKDLIPILRPGARVINCLGAGNGSILNTQDWELKDNFSFIKAAGQYASMTDYLALEFGSRFGHDAQIGFISFNPGVVNTKSVVNQNFPWIVQVGASIVLPIIGTAPGTVAERILKLATDQEIPKGHAGLFGPNGLPMSQLPKYLSQSPEIGGLVYDYVDKVTTP